MTADRGNSHPLARIVGAYRELQPFIVVDPDFDRDLRVTLGDGADAALERALGAVLDGPDEIDFSSSGTPEGMYEAVCILAHHRCTRDWALLGAWDTSRRPLERVAYIRGGQFRR